MRSRDKSYTLYAYYDKASDYQTWQGDDLLKEASVNKVTQPFKHVVVRDHTRNQKCFISASFLQVQILLLYVLLILKLIGNFYF